jgi:hypothetical protein
MIVFIYKWRKKYVFRTEVADRGLEEGDATGLREIEALHPRNL